MRRSKVGRLGHRARVPRVGRHILYSHTRTAQDAGILTGPNYNVCDSQLASAVLAPLLPVSTGVACGGNSAAPPLYAVGDWCCLALYAAATAYSDASTLGRGAFVQAPDLNSGTATQQANDFVLVRVGPDTSIYANSSTTQISGAHLQLSAPLDGKVSIVGAGTLSLLVGSFGFDVYHITAVTSAPFKQYTADRYRFGLTIGDC